MDKNSPYQLSRLGEELAAKYLVSKGYTLLSKNFRTKNGEIDIIVHNDTHLVFVEVKTRRFHSIDAALQTITRRKRYHITQAALVYINQSPNFVKHESRFDIILVFEDKRTNTFSIKHFPDAFHPVFEYNKKR
ncbi:MAG TPA: YraN family protein [Candidatus Cloacimonetes bacterium]|jgi:putative endonuclease|nr:YraN family protein [Candidatus Cloacimonas sp.]HHZ14498.1 YraN family protein [Candidatus Cloacimonadota bacterium]